MKKTLMMVSVAVFACFVFAASAQEKPGTGGGGVIIDTIVSPETLEAMKDAVTTLDVNFYTPEEPWMPAYWFTIPVVNRDYYAELQNIESGQYTITVYARDEWYRNLFEGSAKLYVVAGTDNHAIVPMNPVPYFNYQFTVEGLPVDLGKGQITNIYIEDANGNRYWVGWWQDEYGRWILSANLPLDFTGGTLHIFGLNGQHVACLLGFTLGDALSNQVITAPYIEAPNLGDVVMEFQFPAPCWKLAGDPVIVGSMQFGSLYEFVVDGDILYARSSPDIYIYSLAPNPMSPTQLGTITAFGWKLTAEDGRLAITNNGIVQLYDVKSPSAPVLASSLDPQHNVTGLLIKDKKLYAFSAGALSIYDIADPYQPMPLTRLYYMEGVYYLWNLKQVLPIGNALYLVRGDDGITVLDVTDYNNVSVNNELQGSYLKAAYTGKHLAVLTKTDTILYDVYDDFTLTWETIYGVVPSVKDIDTACDNYIVRTSGQQVTVNAITGEYIGSLTSGPSIFGDAVLYKHWLLSKYSGYAITIVDLAPPGQ